LHTTIISLSIFTLSFSIVVYGLYFFHVLKNKTSTSKFRSQLLVAQDSKADLNPVSIIINTFNEAEVIDRKLINISDLDYPKNKLEVIVVDDASGDGTAEIAQKKINELKLAGWVIRNSKRIGLNRSLNTAMAAASHNFVCVTDSDVMLEKNALRNLVTVLTGVEGVGGVTGKIKPIYEGLGVAQINEQTYRGFYHNSMLGEASLHSAFPGNGPLIVFDKSVVSSTIPVDYGSTDGNIAINVIRSGKRFLYVPNGIVLEPVPEDLGQQRLQKIRRAKRLIQVFLHNRDIFLNKNYGYFGRIVFPLKFLMVSVCPLLLFVGVGLLVIGIILSGNLFLQLASVAGLSLAVFVSIFWRSVGGSVSSFVFHQFYLVIGLLSSMRKSVFWKTIERKKYTFKT
jgi:poly-beta-1,6-N-acetyl-D-glucosamine synthase